MILGINASGRAIQRNNEGILVKGVTEDLINYILKHSREPSEYISLAGKTILGCQGCLKCAADNICKTDDDWGPILDRFFEADAIVFGAPIYYGTINAIGHAFLERFFSFRHRERFKLLGKPIVIVTTGTGMANPAEEYILKMFRSNYMAEPIGILRAKGVTQCYTCGYGENCAAGGVVARHGFLETINNYHIPRVAAETYQKAHVIAQRLGSVIKTNKAPSAAPDTSSLSSLHPSPD